MYLTLYTSACLRKLEGVPTLSAGQKALYALACEPFALPGDAGWPLGGLFSPPATRDEGDLLRAYLRQAREELGLRLAPKCFTDAGPASQAWLPYAKRRFLNKTL